MSAFLKELNKHQTDKSKRRWLFVPYDQLSDQIGPLSEEKPKDIGIILIENRWKPRRRPYHKQKLAIILANQRNFAIEQAKRGVAIEYVFGDSPYSEILKPVLEKVGGAEMMEPAEREMRYDLAELTDLEVIEHKGWLTTPEQFRESQDGLKSWRMDSFYRYLRKETGYLMEDDSPLGGKFSHDADNRESWSGEPPAPTPPTFPTDPIKEEVMSLIEAEFTEHPGRLDSEHLPTTFEDAQKLWKWAKDKCMESFGPYEDAMSSESSGLFHTRLSPLLNIHRILPRQVLEEALELDIPLNSKEGFVRQLLGWREFMRHVHRETDGFRNLNGVEEASKPRSMGGWKWSYKKAKREPGGGATPNLLKAEEPLFPAYWGEAESGLNCLDTVVEEVWREGYSHHITRLMVLANLGTLLDIEPRQLTDWFWVAYCDAYDWVVEPNVLGMGMFALGELFTTKPYVSGAAYIHRMSDYCSTCAFHPKKTCPITSLYWSFLERKKHAFQDNQRMGLMLNNLKKRKKETKDKDAAVYRRLKDALAAGEKVAPKDFQSL